MQPSFFCIKLKHHHVMETNKINPSPTLAEKKQQVHNCLRKLVEIKLILQNIPDPLHPKESVWCGYSSGESWCDLRTNITGIYTDFLEMEVSNE